MSLRSRIQTLEADIQGRQEQERQAHQLITRWEHELADARKAAEHVDPSKPVPRWGVDYAWGNPNPAALKRAGVTFAVRYLGGSPSKDLTRLELENLSHAAIDVAVVWEAAGDAARAGYDAGARDAHAASSQARRVGVPDHRPIYFAVDFDAAGAGQTGRVLEYLRGAAHAIGWPRVGCYAGYGVIEAAHALNRCKYLWQTLAWSGGRWSAHAQLQQRVNGRRVAGVDCDLDRAVAPDFGQFRI